MRRIAVANSRGFLTVPIRDDFCLGPPWFAYIAWRHWPTVLQLADLPRLGERVIGFMLGKLAAFQPSQRVDNFLLLGSLLGTARTTMTATIKPELTPKPMRTSHRQLLSVLGAAQVNFLHRCFGP